MAFDLARHLHLMWYFFELRNYNFSLMSLYVSLIFSLHTSLPLPPCSVGDWRAACLILVHRISLHYTQTHSLNSIILCPVAGNKLVKKDAFYVISYYR